MKLKDFKKTRVFALADSVVYYDKDVEEIDIRTETQRRKLGNKEVVSHETLVDGSAGLVLLEVYLDCRMEDVV